MAQSPEELRQEIEGTRRDLTRNVDRLNEKVSPSKVMQRRVDRAKGGLAGLRDKVMGSAPSSGSSMRDRTQSTASSLSERAGAAGSSVSDTMSSGVQTARSQTQGNPLAAGLIAFAGGWLISSLLPATRAEERLTEQAQDRVKDLAEPLKEQAKQAGTELKEGLQGPAQEAVENLKHSAQSAADTVSDEGKSAADTMQSEGRTSAENVKQAKEEGDRPDRPS